MGKNEQWFKVSELDQLVDGETVVVLAGRQDIALSFKDKKYGAIENICPHKQGPLGEGKIDEQGYLRCPWHDWGFCPFTGEGSSGYNRVKCFTIEVRGDGVYVGV